MVFDATVFYKKSFKAYIKTKKFKSRMFFLAVFNIVLCFQCISTVFYIEN